MNQAPFGFELRVPSMSRGDVSYVIRRGRGGTLYCSCPAWRFQSKPVRARTCKHLRSLETTGKVVGPAPEAVPAPTVPIKAEWVIE